MIRFVTLPGELVLGKNEVVLEVPHSMVATLIVELSLLLAGLAESLRLQATSRVSIVLTVGAGAMVSKASVERVNSNKLLFRIGRNQAEYLQSVLLRAYRDGAAEVSHIHLEGRSSDCDLDLTVLFGTHV